MRSSERLSFSAGRLIVMAAPNGARRTRQDHAALPITPAELADEAGKLLAASVSVLHLHVRDANGAHTLDADAYRAAMRAIRAEVGEALVIQVTTEAVGRYAPAQQMALVRDLRPEAVSLALSELCPDQAAEPEAARFFAWLRAERIWPQFILYSPDELRRFERLRRAGLFSDEMPFCMFVLGRYADGSAGSVAALDGFLLAADCSAFPWAACCFGDQEQAAMLAAYASGGHVRLGFENNLWLPDGTRAGNNAQLIRSFLEAAPGARHPASAQEIRAAFI